MQTALPVNAIVEQIRMFKIGVISDEVSQDFQTVVDFATSFELESIEVRTVWDKPSNAILTILMHGKNI